MLDLCDRMHRIFALASLSHGVGILAFHLPRRRHKARSSGGPGAPKPGGGSLSRFLAIGRAAGRNPRAPAALVLYHGARLCRAGYRQSDARTCRRIACSSPNFGKREP
jgi:hypothetical protein